jgi:hypothetical protein
VGRFGSRGLACTICNNLIAGLLYLSKSHTPALSLLCPEPRPRAFRPAARSSYTAWSTLPHTTALILYSMEYTTSHHRPHLIQYGVHYLTPPPSSYTAWSTLPHTTALILYSMGPGFAQIQACRRGHVPFSCRIWLVPCGTAWHHRAPKVLGRRVGAPPGAFKTIGKKEEARLKEIIRQSAVAFPPLRTAPAPRGIFYFFMSFTTPRRGKKIERAFRRESPLALGATHATTTDNRRGFQILLGNTPLLHERDLRRERSCITPASTSRARARCSSSLHCTALFLCL